MNLWRVLWTDAAGLGRFSDVKADTKEHAAWITCRAENSEVAELVAVLAIDMKAVTQ